MFIALGIIGALWIVGAVIVPDKGGPGVFSQDKPAAQVSQTIDPPARDQQR
jgi:hypothetical protein